jgi:RNA polymerase sigma-70 factor, ECF subfamily
MSSEQPPSRTSHDVTRLLAQLQGGQRDVAQQLIPLVYAELRDLAVSYLRRERSDHTLQPTALVHEAYLRLVDQRNTTWQNRAHFFGIAAQAMRRVLLDHARRKRAGKREGAAQRVTLEEGVAETPQRSIDLIALDVALERLKGIDERQYKVVELRFFGGLDVDQTAEVLQISPATVKRDWTFAKAWLQRELSDSM